MLNHEGYDRTMLVLDLQEIADSLVKNPEDEEEFNYYANHILEGFDSIMERLRDEAEGRFEKYEKYVVRH